MHNGTHFNQPIAAGASSQLTSRKPGVAPISVSERCPLLIEPSRADDRHRSVAWLVVSLLLLLPSTASAHTETGV